MIRNLIIGTILSALVLIPALASATEIIDLVGNSDCDGWDATVSLHWGITTFEADLDYSVVLLDSDGMEVTRSEFAGTITRDSDVNTIQYYSELWGQELCGDYTVTGTFHVTYTSGGYVGHSTMEFASAFTCICDEPGGCFLTPGYWKNHPESWAQDTLMLGGVELSQAELMDILDAPVRGDATVILAHHLIAAKLNVLNGADDAIQSVIDDADNYLTMHPVFSKPNDSEGRQDALDMKDLLADYNEQGCDDEEEEEDDGESNKSAATDARSFGSLKALYK